MTAPELIDRLHDIGVRVGWCQGKPKLLFPDGFDGIDFMAEHGVLIVEHRQAVIDALEADERCGACGGMVRVPKSQEELNQMWSLCRATGGSIMCPSFRVSHPGNSGWESKARWAEERKRAERRERDTRPYDPIPD